MSRYISLLLFIGLAFWGCEEEQDTIPPTVSIQSPITSQTINEIVTIVVETNDNEGINRVEFYIDDSLFFTDTESPYQYDWNTTQYEDNSEHIVKVISYDNSDNSTTSQPIVYVIDNSTSTPNGGNITSVTYTLTEMTVIWEESSDGDFKDYKVLYSDTESGNKDTLETYTDKSTTSYTITEFDPLIENWFWVQVTDTLGLSSIGTGMTNSLDSEPTPVNITSVTYDLESMTITWEEYVPNMGRIQRMNQNTRSTVTNDFVSYELLQSGSEDGTYLSVVVITDQTTTSYSLTEYDPTMENWFKVKVTDFWGLNSTGSEMTNEIDSPPTPSEIYPIESDNGSFIISWSQNNESDFLSYTLYQSQYGDMSDQSIVITINDNIDTSTIISDDLGYFQINTQDIWGQESESNIIGTTNIISGIMYIVGESYNSEGSLTACYWVDGSRVELPGGDWATDIFVSNGTVYTSGTSGANACYWINETRYDLPGNGGEGEAIAVDGNDVYVAGWYNNGSCYWKNGERIDLTTNAESQAFAVGIRSNGDVYVGGYYMNNHHYYIPCFWKNGNERHSLPIPSGGDGEVNDIAIMDGNTRYYAGYTMKPDNFAGYVPKACYWRNTGNRTDLPLGGSSWDIYGATGMGITIDGEDIYVAGYTDWYEFTGEEETTGGSFPQYWKNSTIHDLQGGPLTNFGTGVAYDIRVADGNVVAVGAATRDSSYYDSYLSACYWLNGEKHYLVKQSQVPEGLEDWEWSEARGIFIE